MDTDSVSAERSFLEFLYEQPQEPDWITRILYGIEDSKEPDIQEIKQVSTDNCKFKVQISKAVKISTVGILDYKWSNTVNFPA